MRQLLKEINDFLCSGISDSIDDLKLKIEAELAKPEAEPYQIEWPEYHHQGMGCGLEDRNITDRYDAMEHGWNCAINAVSQSLPKNIYTHPPKQPLSDRELLTLRLKNECTQVSGEDFIMCAKLVELAHSITDSNNKEA